MKWPRDVRIKDRIYHTKNILIAALVTSVLMTGGLLVGNFEMPSLSWKNETTSTQTVPLLITMRNISQYHAATGTFQTLVDRDTDTPLPDFISGEHVTVYAVGTSDATVDFGALTEDNIEVSSDRRSVSIDLPAVKLTPVALDPFETRVVNRDRGFIERFGDAYNDVPDSNRDIFVQAQGVLYHAALESDLRNKGAENTRAMLDGMCRSLGFTDVKITFAEPEEPKG